MVLAVDFDIGEIKLGGPNCKARITYEHVCHDILWRHAADTICFFGSSWMAKHGHVTQVC